MSLFRKMEFVDKIESKRIGLVFLRVMYNYIDIKPPEITKSDFNVILEVKEIFCDKSLSKIKVVDIPFNKSDYSKRKILNSKHFCVWIENKNIYWLSPPTDVDRDNKLKEILK